MHKKLLKRIRKRLDELKHSNPKAYEASERRLGREARRIRA
jgi:hypothetical protein